MIESFENIFLQKKQHRFLITHVIVFDYLWTMGCHTSFENYKEEWYNKGIIFPHCLHLPHHLMLLTIPEMRHYPLWINRSSLKWGSLFKVTTLENNKTRIWIQTYVCFPYSTILSIRLYHKAFTLNSTVSIYFSVSLRNSLKIYSLVLGQ